MKNYLSGMESEHKWIDEHPEYYNNKEHQEFVKRNIEIRYRCNKMLNSLNKVLEK